MGRPAKSYRCDAYVRTEGHGPYATVERWINGANVADTGTRFDPAAKGYIEMARLVQAALGRN